METEIKKLVFFHGTGVASAGRILAQGFRDVDQLGWRTLACEIWSALLEVIGDESNLLNRYLEHGDLRNGPGARPLRTASAQRQGHHFVYGPFYVTLDLGCAYRYAVRNPFRSELLHGIAHGLQLLERCGGARRVGELQTRHPQVMEMIRRPGFPVVLELTGIEEHRLRNQDGSELIQPRIEQYLAGVSDPDAYDPASFRVQDVTRADVIAVHDLRGWVPGDIWEPPWQPGRDAVDEARIDLPNLVAWSWTV